MSSTVPFPAREGRRERRAPALLLLLPLSALTACGAAVEAQTPACIVIVTLDTTRADHLTPYGYFRDTTPWLDAFAREAVVFERFIVPMATTLPTHTSIMTGTHPLEHGVLGNLKHTGHLFQPSKDLQSFAEACRAAGYATGGFVSAVPLKRGTGIEIGFDRFDEPEEAMCSATATNARVFEWLDEIEGRPFLLWVHYFDPHFPLEPPPAYAAAFERDAGLERWIEERRITPLIERKKFEEFDDAYEVHNLYDAELAYLDDQLHALFARLADQPGFEDACIVIAGDHGEALNQHAKTGHGGTFEEELHAPFLLRAPGLEPRRVPYAVTAADVLPTLLGHMRAPELTPFLDQASGRDALASGFEPTPIASQDSGRGLEEEGSPFYRYSWTGERWKLVRVESWLEERLPKRSRRVPGQLHPQVGYMLFDLDADPHELEDLAQREPELVQRLAAELEAAVERLEERGRALAASMQGADAELDPMLDQRRRDDLRGLGYAGGPDDDDDDGGGDDDD